MTNKKNIKKKKPSYDNLFVLHTHARTASGIRFIGNPKLKFYRFVFLFFFFKPKTCVSGCRVGLSVFYILKSRTFYRHNLATPAT